jgi:hypothetical protein
VAGTARDGDLPAEQPYEPAGDREAQPGAAVVACGAAVALDEVVEDAPLNLGRHPDPGVADAERDHRARPRKNFVGGAPTAIGAADVHLHRTVLGELERVGEQVAQHIVHERGVGADMPRKVVRQLDGERHAVLVGDAIELLPQGVLDLGQRDLSDLRCDRARPDLREIQDAAEQPEQIGARGMNHVGILHLLRRQVVLGVVPEQFREDQQTVQRGAQLVRHVREELRLVPERDRQLRGLGLDQAPGSLELLLPIDLVRDVTRHQQEPDRFALGAVPERHHDSSGEGRAVLACPLGGPLPQPVFRGVSHDRRGQPRTDVVFGVKLGLRVADDLVRLVTVQPSGTLVPEDDHALPVGGDDRVFGRRLEHAVDERIGSRGVAERLEIDEPARSRLRPEWHRRIDQLPDRRDTSLTMLVHLLKIDRQPIPNH